MRAELSAYGHGLADEAGNCRAQQSRCADRRRDQTPDRAAARAAKKDAARCFLRRKGEGVTDVLRALLAVIEQARGREQQGRARDLAALTSWLAVKAWSLSLGSLESRAAFVAVCLFGLACPIATLAPCSVCRKRIIGRGMCGLIRWCGCAGSPCFGQARRRPGGPFRAGIRRSDLAVSCRHRACRRCSMWRCGSAFSAPQWLEPDRAAYLLGFDLAQLDGASVTSPAAWKIRFRFCCSARC